MPGTFISRWVVLVAVLLGVGAASAEPRALLFFGNSFTIHQEVWEDVGRLAVADGHEPPILVADLANGTDLDRHIGRVRNAPHANVASDRLPDGETWDAVIMQGYSTEATHLGDRADFVRDMHELYTLVRDHPSGRGRGVVGILYETWARSASHPFYREGKFESPAAMQAEVRAGYRQALEHLRTEEGEAAARIAPVGSAFEKTGFDEKLIYARDHYHQGRGGALLASMVLYRTIYDEHVADIAFDRVEEWARVSEANWRQLATVADGMLIDAAAPAAAP